MAISFKGAHFPPDIILMGVRWYVAYPLSYRHVEELLEERGVPLDHATIQRWVVKYSPLLEEAFHRRKRPVWVSWRMDETYIKVKGHWWPRSRRRPLSATQHHLTTALVGISWHCKEPYKFVSSILTISVTTTYCIPITYKRIFISMTYKNSKKIK
jgi:hypothetical protein